MSKKSRTRESTANPSRRDKQNPVANAITLVERMQYQIAFEDAEEGGMMGATYIQRTTSEDRRRVRTLYPTIFPLHVTVETPSTMERAYAHWLIADTLTFLPQAGDLFSYTLTYECDDDEDECCFRVVGWSYEAGTDKTIIKLEAEPVSQASYYKEAWLASQFWAARTEVEEIPF